MTAKFIFIVLSILLGVSQVSCAKGVDKEEIVAEKKEVPDAHAENAELNDKTEKLLDELDQDITEIVNEAINQPTVYVLPQNILDILQNNQVSHNVWAERIAAIQKVIELENAKIAIAKAHQGTDRVTIVHTLRTHLASVGVPYEDLSNWKLEGTRAARKTPTKPPEKKEK